MTLYEVLPDKLEHRGKEYRLYASFDRILEALAFMKRQDFSDAEKTEYLTFLFFGEGVEPDAELVSAALALLCPASKNSGVRSFDWEQDAAVIYAVAPRKGSVD